MKKKVGMIAGFLLTVCLVYLICTRLITKDYVIPYALTVIYGENLEEIFYLDSNEVNGEILWECCQRDEDNNIIVTMTEEQRFRMIQWLEDIFDEWKMYGEYDGYEVSYNDAYTQICFTGKSAIIMDCLPEEDIHFMIIFFHFYQIFRGTENQIIELTVTDPDGNELLKKYVTDFPADVKAYELPASYASYLEEIEETGNYEAINLDYDGNITIIATPEEYDRLDQKIKELCK